MKAHLEQRLKELQGNLALMLELHSEPLNRPSLTVELKKRINERMLEIKEIKNTLAKSEGQYPNTTNA